MTSNLTCYCRYVCVWVPGGTSGKQSACQCRLDVRDTGSIPALGRFPGGGHGSSFHYSRLENPMDKGSWQTAVHRVAQSRTQLKWHSAYTDTHTHTHTHTHSFPGSASGEEPACQWRRLNRHEYKNKAHIFVDNKRLIYSERMVKDVSCIWKQKEIYPNLRDAANIILRGK